jgi:tyrosinase
MRFSLAFTAGLLGSASAGAIKFQENDALAAKGMTNLAAHVAKNGYPAPEKCTLQNVAVRREWLV